MLTYLLAALVFGLVVTGMALGVILSNKPIKGSCGGMSAIGMDTACDICGGDPKVCEEETKALSAKKSGAPADLFYDAGDR